MTDSKRPAKAWIEVPEPDSNSDDALRRLHDAARDPATGEVDHILAVHGLHPEGLEAHLNLYRVVMRGTKTLRKVDRELLAFVVSKLNECHY